MKEIKFRVWCEFEIGGKLYKEMAGPENWFLLTQTGKLYAHGPMPGLDMRIAAAHTKIIPMLCADLKDKHNKEGYFDDIIKSDNGHIGVIKWDEKKLRVYFDWDDSQATYPLEHYEYIDFEIIGNIHENPELLEVK